MSRGGFGINPFIAGFSQGLDQFRDQQAFQEEQAALQQQQQGNAQALGGALGLGPQDAFVQAVAQADPQMQLQLARIAEAQRQAFLEQRAREAQVKRIQGSLGQIEKQKRAISTELRDIGPDEVAVGAAAELAEAFQELELQETQLRARMDNLERGIPIASAFNARRSLLDDPQNRLNRSLRTIDLAIDTLESAKKEGPLGEVSFSDSTVTDPTTGRRLTGEDIPRRIAELKAMKFEIGNRGQSLDFSPPQNQAPEPEPEPEPETTAPDIESLSARDRMSVLNVIGDRFGADFFDLSKSEQDKIVADILSAMERGGGR